MIALLEFADALHRRAGECAALVTEEFAFEQLFRNGGAIDREKRLLISIAVMINGAGNKLLARAAFTGDERGRIACGDLADKLENLLHRFAAADNAKFIVL